MLIKCFKRFLIQTNYIPTCFGGGPHQNMFWIILLAKWWIYFYIITNMGATLQCAHCTVTSAQYLLFHNVTEFVNHRALVWKYGNHAVYEHFKMFVSQQSPRFTSLYHSCQTFSPRQWARSDPWWGSRIMFSVFFWVIPRRLNFVCRRFRTLSIPSS
jgi:hypothetical protein